MTATTYKTDSSPLPRPLTVTRPDDPAYRLILDAHTTTPIVGIYRSSCFICRDPEFAQMGLPLCRPCSTCTTDPATPAGHIPADDIACSDCGAEEGDDEGRKS